MSASRLLSTTATLSKFGMVKSVILKRRIIYETFARAGFLFSGKAKVHAMREFTQVNDRLSTISTRPESKKTIVERFSYV